MTILGSISKIPTAALEYYPGNARRGDVNAIAKSLETFGQFQPVIYQRSTSYVLIGNHTLRAAQQLRWAEIAAAPVEVDDEQARKIVLAANRTSDLATYDMDALVALLQDVDNLEGTGFDDSDLVDLLNDDIDTDDDTEAPTKPTRLGVVVYTEDVTQQMELMARMLEEGWDARAL